MIAALYPGAHNIKQHQLSHSYRLLSSLHFSSPDDRKMARTTVHALVLSVLFSLAIAANHNFSNYTFSNYTFSNYTFSATPSNEIGQGDTYQLYWNIDRTGDPLTSTISFAVRVRTTGWVGLGISPTGDMTGSDVVIGWVNDQGDYFMKDRFADERAMPPIDDSQDWFITAGAEEDGYTILEFYRKWVTCDDRDNPIEANTARVVFSWSNTDPVNDDENNIQRHDQRGSISLNLLGGQATTPKLPDDAKTFVVRVENITIPATDTTYFCQPYELSEDLVEAQHYIVKFSPLLTEESKKYVHHVLIYLCNKLTSEDLETGGDCDGGVTQNIAQCRGGTVFAAWAVGGGDFYYPENIYYPFGGPTNSKYILMEMHYNNPSRDAGVTDSSGFEFTYTDMKPTYEAAILTIGHIVTPEQIIPPGAKSFKSIGLCASGCTSNLLPKDGITVFANLLHTHLIGTGLVYRQLRKSKELEEECDLYAELPPIDKNLQYDFNFQQMSYLPEPIQILPGDKLVLECYYDSSDRTNVTLGGERTSDEMCLAFSVYYPRSDLKICESIPDLTNWVSGLPKEIQDEILSPGVNIDRYRAALNSINWKEQTELLQNNITSDLVSACDPDLFYYNQDTEVDCPYVAPDICVDTPTSSLECVCPATEPTDGAGALTISTLLMVLCIVAFL